MNAAWIAIGIAGVGVAACSGDLFHATDWPTGCATDPSLFGCRGGGGASASSAAVSATSSAKSSSSAKASNASSSASASTGAGGAAPTACDAYCAGVTKACVNAGGGPPVQQYDDANQC